MANEKQASLASVINRALGIIEGVMLVTQDTKVEQTLATAVEMIDEAMKEVFADDK